jgi:hypothetical protein
VEQHHDRALTADSDMQPNAFGLDLLQLERRWKRLDLCCCGLRQTQGAH